MAAFNFLKAAQCSNKNNAKEDGRTVEHVRGSEQRPTKRELSYAKRNSSVNGNFGFSSLPLNFSLFFSLVCLFILASFFVRLCAVVCTLRGSKCISAVAKTFIGFFSTYSVSVYGQMICLKQYGVFSFPSCMRALTSRFISLAL